MTQHILVLSAMLLLFSSCTNYEHTQNIPTQTTTNTPQMVQQANVQKSDPSLHNPIPTLKDSEHITFPDNCTYYRCTTYIVKDATGKIVYPEHYGPKGYSILPASIGSKDYILVVAEVSLGEIHEGDVYTYNIHTFEIHPFMIDDRKKQIHLEEKQGLLSKTSFDNAHKHILIVFNYEEWNESCADCHHTTNIHFKEAYTYDDKSDQLRYLPIEQPNLIFASNDLGTMEHSSFFYNSSLGTITSWNYRNTEIYRGPIGEPDTPLGPVVLYNLNTQKAQNIIATTNTQLQYITPLAHGQIISFTMGEGDKTVQVSNNFMTMEGLTITDLRNSQLPQTTFTLTPAVRAYLTQYQDMNKENNPAASLEYGCTDGKMDETSITLQGLQAQLLLTKEGQTITKAHIIPYTKHTF